jgi:hypothetical protein
MVFYGTGSFTVYDGTAAIQTGGDLTISPGSVFTQGYSVQWLGVASQPSSVQDSGAALTGWTWSASNGGTLSVALGPGPHHLTLTP